MSSHKFARWYCDANGKYWHDCDKITLYLFAVGGFFCQTTSGNNKRKKYLTQKNSKFGMKLKRDKMIFIEHDVSVLRHFSQD